MAILEQIKDPKDLRMLNSEALPKLAKEVRQRILDVVSRKGGHLGSSLGATELTIALHYVFNTPLDKIVWDTGHQTYGHKLLTGRQDRFESIRQLNGLSGFLKRDESPYDAFGAGHASTAISAALGMAVARDQQKEDHRVVAVVSDGCITGGMSFEALQNAGHIGSDLLVVLNDNEMFISNRVGALGAFLTKLLTGGLAKKLEHEVEKFLKRIQFYGSGLLRVAKRMRVLLFPGMLFEELGFAYFGPVDGHDVSRLVEVLENIKTLKGPVLLHIITKKGKGYDQAEADPITWHAPGLFDVTTGKITKSTTVAPPAYQKVFGEALVKIAKADPRVACITAAMPEGTGTDVFRREIPNRYYDVGLAEQHAVTFAAGMACEGLKPVCAIYSTFLQRGYDQMEHDVGLQKLPVVFCLDRAGLVGEDGPTHHGVFDFAYSRMIPNFVVMAPSDENELQHMLKTALSLNNVGSVIRYPRGAGEGVPLDSDFRILPIGRGVVLKPGAEVYLLGIGAMVHPCLKAAAILEKEGIQAGVVNMRFVKPIDSQLLNQLLQQTPNFVTVEDHVLPGGFGSAVMEAMEGTEARIHRIGIPDKFIEHGPQKVLRDMVGLTPEKIAQSTLEFLRGKKAQAAAQPTH
jgi:1-deoxy-D-xylulose-5-phosphate synthase